VKRDIPASVTKAASSFAWNKARSSDPENTPPEFPGTIDGVSGPHHGSITWNGCLGTRWVPALPRIAGVPKWVFRPAGDVNRPNRRLAR
jgi:hypothetical protein